MIVVAPDLNLSRFLDEVAHHPILTPIEERDLIRSAQSGSLIARRKLIASNLKFVIKVAKRYRHTGIPLRDLVGEGVLGLDRAILRFDLGRDLAFLTYAVWWVRQAIITAIHNTARTVRITAEHEAPIRRLRRLPLTQAIGGEYVEDVEAFAKKTGLPALNLLASLQASYGGYRMDQPLNEAGGTLADILPSETESPEDHAQALNRLALLNRLRGKLTPIQRQVVTRFYGLDGRPAATLRDIGVYLNLSHERIRQIRNDAMATMKRWARRFPE